MHVLDDPTGPATQVPTAVATSGEHWLMTFQPWGPLHIISFIIGLSVIIGLSWIGLRLRGTAEARRFRRMWGWWIMATWMAVNIIWLSPWKFDVKTSLPLQICDWAGFWAGLVCLTNWHWARVLLYYWGIGLSTQAFFTPTVRDGIDSFDYWQFWINHTQIIATAFFDVIVRRYRPTWRDWAFVVLVTVAYAASMVGFNLLVPGANYVYVGNLKPKNPTLIDKLGPWPFRLLPLSTIVIVAFTVLTVAWHGRRTPRSIFGPGRCERCGHDLGVLPSQANESGAMRCPECGHWNKPQPMTAEDAAAKGMKVAVGVHEPEARP